MDENRILDIRKKVVVTKTYNYENFVNYRINERFISFVFHNALSESCGINFYKKDDYLLLVCGICKIRGEKIVATPDLILKYCITNNYLDNYFLEGNYSYILLDINKKTILAEVDQFGVQPLYYFVNDDFIILSSEIKSITSLMKLKIDICSIAEFLNFGFSASQDTFVYGINRLMPYERLQFKKRNLIFNKLKKREFERSKNINDDTFKRLSSAFEENLCNISNKKNRHKVLLSGGLDSRIALVAAKKIGIEPDALTIGEKGSLEVKVAVKFSKIISSKIIRYENSGKSFSSWVEKAVWITEGRTPINHMHYMEGLTFSMVNPKIFIHGLLGDVIIGGDYDNRDVFNKKKRIKEESIKIIQEIYWPEHLKKETLKDNILNKIATAKEKIADNICKRINFRGEYSDYLWFRYFYRGFYLIVPSLTSQIIRWGELCLPYLTNEIFEICSDIKFEQIFNRKLQIAWALKMYPEVAKLDRVKDGVLISISNTAEDVYNKKIKRRLIKNKIKYYLCRLTKGFIDMHRRETYPYYDRLYRKEKEVQKYVNQILFSDSFLARDLYERKGITQITSDHKNGRNYWHIIGNFLLLEIFIRQFIEQTEIPHDICFYPIREL